MTPNNTPPEASKGIDSEWLRELLTSEMHDVARKAQIDYIAVNHPQGIRHGEGSQLLAEFIRTNVGRAEASILAHIERMVKEARIKQVSYDMDCIRRGIDLGLTFRATDIDEFERQTIARLTQPEVKEKE